MSQQKPKEPLLAVMLTTIYPGLGHLYAGAKKRGWVFIILFISVLIFLCTTLLSPTLNILYFIVYPVFGFVVLNLYVIIDSYFSANRFNRRNNLERTTSFRLKVLLGCGIIFFGFFFSANATIRKKFVRSFSIPSDTMSPVLQVKDRIFVDMQIYKKSLPQRGDVIIVESPENRSIQFVKRVVGLPGETVEIKDSYILINGSQLVGPKRVTDNSYYNRGEYAQLGKAVTVPEGHYFLLGDNNRNSFDSRFWGFLPKNKIVGKVSKIYWPLDRAGMIE